jgi:hypothetical protein
MMPRVASSVRGHLAEEIGARGLLGPAQLAPDIQLPGQLPTQHGMIAILKWQVVHGARFGAADQASLVQRRAENLRKQVCPGRTITAHELLDIGDSDLEVEVVHDRVIDQPVQRRVAQQSPPFEVGGFAHRAGGKAPVFGCCYLWLFEVRADLPAAGNRQRDHHQA